MACGSNPSRAPTSTSIALWTSTPGRRVDGMLERRILPFEPGGEATLAATELVEGFLPEPERLPELQLARRSFDPIDEALPEIRGEDGPLRGADQPVQGPPLRVGEEHRIMVGTETDMTEHPDDILRALADPERLRIAGALAAGDAAAATLAESLSLPLARVRRHLNRLAAAGVARLQPDRRTYRLDPETLRWAAEQVGPPRDAGIALGAANEDEEAVLRRLLPRWAPHGGADEGVETPDRPRTRRARVRARSPLRRARGERDRRSVLQRSRRPPPVPRRRGIPRSRGRRSTGGRAGASTSEPW